MKLGHKVAIVAASVVGPGFAQALSGRRRAALVWLVLGLAPALLATVWIGVPFLALAVRLAAGIGAYREVPRFEAAPSWLGKLSTAALAIGIAGFVLLRVSVETFRIPSSSMYPTIEIGDYVMVDRLSLRWRTPERGEVIVFRFPCDRTRPWIKRVIAVGGDTVEVRCSRVFVNGEQLPSTTVRASTTYRDLDESDRTWITRPVRRYRETHGGHTYDVFGDLYPATDTHDFPRRERMFAPSCQRSDAFAPDNRIPQLAGDLVVTKPNAPACELQAHFVVPRGGLFVMGDNRSNANDSRYWGVVSEGDVIGRAMGIWMTKAPGSDGTFGRAGSIE